MQKAVLIFFLMVAIVGFIQAFSDHEETTLIAEPVAPPSPFQDSLSQYIAQFDSALVNESLRRGLPGGAFVITYGDSILLAKGFGVRKVGEPETIDENTVFRLGSVSKGFAGILAGMMVEQGIISWEDTVSHIVPYFQLKDSIQTDKVQIKHILSHTSGLPRHSYTNLVEDGLSLERIIPQLKKVELISEVGEQIAYQNAAFAVIEKVLESKTNQGFATLLQEDIFSPLEMNNASTNYATLMMNGNVAQPHFFGSKNGRMTGRIKNNYYNTISAGGVNASILDMGKYLLMLTGNRPDLISEETLDEVFAPEATINNKRFSRYWPGVNKSYYAKGWRVLENGEQTIVYHGGYVNGYRSEIAFDRNLKLGICILYHSPSSYALRVIPEFFNGFNELTTSFDSTTVTHP